MLRIITFFKKEFGASILILIIISVSMWFFNHREFALFFAVTICILSTLKVLYLFALTLKKVNNHLIIDDTHNEMIVFLAVIMFLIIISFSFDYICLSYAMHDSFDKTLLVGNSYLLSLFNSFYFSLISFASIGYGDIVPVNIFAKYLVILEIITAAIMIFFVLGNFTKWKK